MIGYFSPNYESDIDGIIQDLADINISTALLWFLHSRVFAKRNQIGISQEQLAEIFGVSSSSINRAVEKLESKGLLEVRTTRGQFGGSVFSLKRFPTLLSKVNEIEPCGQRFKPGIKSPNFEGVITAKPRVKSSVSVDKSCKTAGAIPAKMQDNIDKDIDRDSIEKDRRVAPSQTTEEIISYLNDIAGTDYDSSLQVYSELISERLNEGYQVEDFKRVVDCKCKEWQGSSKMNRWLRPETLFAASHFSNYLLQANESFCKKDGDIDGYTSEYDHPLGI